MKQMVGSVVGIKPRAVQCKVWFGSSYFLEKNGSSQFPCTFPALQGLTCAWKEGRSLRIHFPKETIKSMDTPSSASNLCHQKTVHPQSSESIREAPCTFNALYILQKTTPRSLVWISLLQLTWACPGDRLVVPQRSLNRHY